ncbi:MAG: hypothetical protein JSS10_09175 [Verrucomicrobia bacterium]|nr:hypothetical protein [Verrucomicrobiota bacterium]
MKILLSLLLLCQTLLALPAQVIVVRHGEKDPVTRGLTEQGKERAVALAYFLTGTDYLLNFGPPAAIFASRSIPVSDRLVPRTIETIMPTAQLLQLPVHIPFTGYQVHEIASLVLSSKKYDGKNILICWNHSSIHDLLHAFGYQAPFNCTATSQMKPYPDCRFDLVFVMTFPAPPPPASIPAPFNPNLPFATLYFQQLLFGDLTCPLGDCPFGSCPNNYPPTPPFPTPCSCTFDGVPVDCMFQICNPPCPNIGLGDD